MSDEDVAIAAFNVGGTVVHNGSDSPLTSEQRAFAEVIGQEIARFWKETHQDGHTCTSHRPDLLA